MLSNCSAEEDLERPLDFKEMKPVNPKGNEPWIFIGRTDAEFEAPILWPPDVKSWHTGKDPDAGKDWRQEEKGTTEDEMAGWHYRLKGHEFEQTPGDGEGHSSLVCCSPEIAKSQTRLSNWTTILWVFLDHVWADWYLNKIRQCVRKERERQETKRMLAEGRKMTLGEMRFTPKAERPCPSEPRLSLSACSTAPVRSGRNQTSSALGCRAQSRSRKMRNCRLLDSFFF